MNVRHHGVIAAGHPAVVSAGCEILERGGNAVDAAVAAMFTAFQAELVLATAGGAGFLVAEIDGEAVAYDFFSTAPGLGRDGAPYQPPEGAFRGIDVDFGSAHQTFHIGSGSIAVPSSLAGLCQAQQEAGRLRLDEVLAPAIRACYAGTVTTRMSGFILDLLGPIIRSTPEFERFFLDPNGDLLKVGDTYKNEDLGRFFEAVAQARSGDILYHGSLAQRMLDEVQSKGGGLTRQDLESYKVRRLAPVEANLQGAQVLLAPPPSSGGMLIAYGLALLDSVPYAKSGSVEEVLLLRAVMAETLRARADVMGPHTPEQHHAEQILDGAYIEAGARRLKRLLELGPAPLESKPIVDDLLGSTTHVSAIDERGNACSITISSGECSGIVLPDYGVFLNNFLGEEDLNPCGFHRFPPGVRLGSTMTPTLVRANQRDTMVALGSGGSNRIRTALLQVLRNLLFHGMSADAAVHADRLHYENGCLYAEGVGTHARALDHLASTPMELSRFGDLNMFFGGVHTAVRKGNGVMAGVGDRRRSGKSRII